MLDAGVFVALGRQDHVALALLNRLKHRVAIAVAASTISEIWRRSGGLCETRFGLLRPTVVPVDAALAKRAGELLRQTGGSNTLDAIVVAVAEHLEADRIYTSDVDDVEMLLTAAADWRCEVVGV